MFSSPLLPEMLLIWNSRVSTLRPPPLFLLKLGVENLVTVVTMNFSKLQFSCDL